MFATGGARTVVSFQQQPAEAELDPGGMRIRQRLRALRGRYPGVALATELTHIHDDQVVLRATISFPDGTAVSAYAAEPTDSTGLLDGALELAEQRATARALDLLGVGEVPDGPRREARVEDPAPEPTPEPVRQPIVRPEERNTPSVVEALRRGTRQRAQAEPEVASADPAPAAERPPRTVITAPVTERPGRPPLAERPDETDPDPGRRPQRPPVEEPPVPDAEVVRRAVQPDRSPVPPPESAADPDMADYSWTHFWTWAREYDLKTKGQVEQKIGRTIDGLNPQDVRQLLNEAGVPL
jgi:hypothetical protein